MTAVEQPPPHLGEPSMRRVDWDDAFGGEMWSVVCTTCGYEWIDKAWASCVRCIARIEAESGGPLSEYQPWPETLNKPPLPADDRPWPEPVPLQGQRDCPVFPLDALPDWIAAQCLQVADEMQYGPDLPAQLAISALSTCLTKRIEVSVNGPWVEGVNVWTVTAMAASAGKSPAFKHMLGPIRTFEEELAERIRPQVEDRELVRKMTERERDEAIRKGEKAAALKANDELRENPSIHVPKLTAEDATPEALAVIMSVQDGRIALISTEGGLFGLMAGRYSESSNLDIYLQSWSGDHIAQDRIGRESLNVRDPRLTIGLTVQPHVIAKLSDHDEFAGRGLLQRFLYSMPRSTVGNRDKRRRSTWRDGVNATYGRNIIALADEYLDRPMRRLTFSPDALEVFQAWQQAHEDRMGEFGELAHIAEWVSKMESAVCRVSALFHVVEKIPGDIIEADVVARAMTIGDYWEAHAKIAGDLWGADVDVAKALKVLGWAGRLLADGTPTFTIRDVMRALRSTFPKAEDVVPALRILTESGWIRPDDGLEPESRGRRDNPQVFTVRSDYAEYATESERQSTQSTQSPRGKSQNTHSLSSQAHGCPTPRTVVTDVTDSKPTPDDSTTQSDGDWQQYEGEF